MKWGTEIIIAVWNNKVCSMILSRFRSKSTSKTNPLIRCSLSIRWKKSNWRESTVGKKVNLDRKETYISIQRKRALLDSPPLEAFTKSSHSFVEVLSEASAKKITKGSPRDLYFGKFFVVNSFWNDQNVNK